MTTKTAIQSVKALLHGKYAEWAIKSGNHDWQDFVAENYQTVKSAISALGEATNDASLASRAAHQTQMVPILISHNLLDGSELAIKNRLALIQETRKLEQETIAAQVRGTQALVDGDALKNLATAMVENINMLELGFGGIKAEFTEIADREAGLIARRNELVDELTETEEFGGESSAKLEQYNDLLKQENSRRNALLRHQTALVEQLSGLSAAYDQVRNTMVQSAIDAYNAAHPLTFGAETIGTRSFDRIYQQFGVEARDTLGAVHIQQTETAMNELGQRLRMLQDAVSPRSAAPVDVEIAEYDALDPNAIAIHDIPIST